MKSGIVVILVAIVIGFSNCSQPVLESQNCIAAREPVRRLYSLHIDGGPNPSGEKLEKLKQYLSETLFNKLSTAKKDEADYLTGSIDFPKATRTGACKDSGEGTEFDVILLWHREEKNIERLIHVKAINENGWVVDSVRPAK